MRPTSRCLPKAACSSRPKPQRYPIAGKVAWVTPAKASHNRAQGVGIRFPKDDNARALKLKIEELLGGQMASDRQTQTI